MTIVIKMQKSKKISLWIAGFLGFLLLMLVVAAVALPLLVNLKQLKEDFQQDLSVKLGGQVTFDDIQASLFPPRGTLSDVKFQLADISGRLASIEAGFEIWPLFLGQLKIDRITLAQPDVTVNLAEKLNPAQKSQDIRPEPHFQKLQKRLSTDISRIMKKLPNAQIRIENGGILLKQKDQARHRFQNINAQIVAIAETLDIVLAADSDLWQFLSFKSRFDQNGSITGGRLEIKGLQPGQLSSFLSPEILEASGSDHISLQLLFESKGLEEIEGSLQARTRNTKAADPVELVIAHFSYNDHRVVLQGLDLKTGRSHIKVKNARMRLEAESDLEIHAASGDIDLDQVVALMRPWAVQLGMREESVSELKRLQGLLKFSSLDIQGPLKYTGQWQFSGKGTVQNIAIEDQKLPGIISVDEGAFSIQPDMISLKDMQGDFLDAALRIGGDIEDYMTDRVSFDLNLEGDVGHKAVAWLKDRRIVPSWLTFDAPVTISGGRLALGPERETLFRADLSVVNGPQATLDLTKDRHQLNIRRLDVKDSESEATLFIRLVRRDRDLEIGFKGLLTEKTFHRLIRENRIKSGWIQGDFNLDFSKRSRVPSRIQGKIRGGDFIYRNGDKDRVQVRKLSARGEGEQVRIESADLRWRETDIDMKGDIGRDGNRIIFDMQAASPGIDWKRLNRIVEKEAGKKSGAGEIAHAGDEWTLAGKVNLKADYFNYGDLTWKPLEADISLKNRVLSIQIDQGNLCRIQTDASARISSENINIEAEAADKPLAPALNCLLESKLMSGKFNLNTDIKIRSHGKNLLHNLEGRFDFTSNDGRIFKFDLLAKILAVVNITEILKGQAPDLTGEGFGYETAKATGTIEKGVMTLDETYIHGKSVDLAFAGDIDILDKQIDLTVLVTPLKTVDSIIEKIPIVGGILGKNFLALPVRATGDLADPQVIPISPSAVGKGLLGIVERTLKLPVKLVAPLFPDKKKKENTGTP